MKRPALIINLVIWMVIAIGATAFLAWYHLAGAAAGAAEATSGLVPVLRVATAPFLLYALGVIMGLLLVVFKKISMGGAARMACRIAGIAALAVILVTTLPSLIPGTAADLIAPAIVVVYVASAAPIMIMMFGFLYALGLAPKDTTRRGPFAKYLPDDHFE